MPPARLRALLPALALALAPGLSEAQPPLTVSERLAACTAAEDADPARAVALADSVLAESQVIALTQRIDALGCRGWSLASLGRPDDARRDVFEMRALLQEHDANPDRARLTRRAGTILHRSGDRVGAVELWAQALADAEVLGLDSERIALLINLGVLHSEFEEHERARVNYEQALALMALTGDHRHEAPVRYNLALNLAGQERHAEAVPNLERTLDLILETGIGGHNQEVAVRLALARSLQRAGSSEAARAMLAHLRGMQVPAENRAAHSMMQVIEVDQLIERGEYHAALEAFDAIELGQLQEIMRMSSLRTRVSLLERLGRLEEALETQRRIGEMREAYLRGRNHERMAALEAHLRDREQRMELDRLQAAAELQVRRIAATARLQWVAAAAAGLILLLGTGVVLWQRRMNRRLERISRTDPLTGLANRRAMAARLRARSVAQEGIAAVLLIDIDHFKRVNDAHGHDAGDRVLVAFGERLRASAGAGADVARWGGEEFLVLLPSATLDAVRTKAEVLRVALARPIDIGTGRVSVEVSIGFASLPLCGERSPEAWHYSLQLADGALYLAKAAGRNAWAGYWQAAPLPGWTAERLGREARLARVQGELELHASRPLGDALIAAS
jgi:diguanylate cyclase (GGDEF)-like protein